MVPDTAARLAKLRQIVLQSRNKPRSVSPSVSEYSDYSDTDSAGEGNEGNSIWDADLKEHKAPPGQWQVPPGPTSHFSVETVRLFTGFVPTGPGYDSYEADSFSFPHFHPAHHPHFFAYPSHPGHHPHFPPDYGFAPHSGLCHPHEWHSLPPQEMEDRDERPKKKRSAKGPEDTLGRKAWKRLPDGPLEEQETFPIRRTRLKARVDVEAVEDSCARKLELKEGTRTIKISKVPKSVSLKHLQELFQTVGEVKRCKMDESGEALLTFEQAQHAAKAAELFSEGTLDGHTIEVRVHDASA
eukprot:symbB.v1.2.031202.t1/scaffold3596.1/size57580/1